MGGVSTVGRTPRRSYFASDEEQAVIAERARTHGKSASAYVLAAALSDKVLSEPDRWWDSLSQHRKQGIMAWLTRPGAPTPQRCGEPLPFPKEP